MFPKLNEKIAYSFIDPMTAYGSPWWSKDSQLNLSYSGGVCTMTGTDYAFRYMTFNVTDLPYFEITTRVTANAWDWVIRLNAANGLNKYILVSVGWGNIYFQHHQLTTFIETMAQQSASIPRYVRIRFDGTNIQVWHSSDNRAYTFLYSEAYSVWMGGRPLYVGIGRGGDPAIATASFDRFIIQNTHA